MTIDPTNIDPSVVASFWIYFIVSFVGGCLIGFIVSKLFFLREKRILEEKKEKYEEQQKEFDKLVIKYEKIESELGQLKDEISTNEVYWAMKESKKQDGSVLADDALKKALFNKS